MLQIISSTPQEVLRKVKQSIINWLNKDNIIEK